MSALPTHKKSPAELAKLRESLAMALDDGPPVSPAGTAEPAARGIPQAPATPVTPAAIGTLLPAAQGPRTQRSLKRSERVAPPAPEPVVVVAAVPILEAPGGPVEHLAVPTEPVTAAHEPKQVRSLKRSERMGGPVSHSQPRPAPADSRLPGHRHSDEELAAIRRRAAMAAIAEGGFEIPEAASTPLIATGYVLALGGAAFPPLLKLLAWLMDSPAVGTVLSSGYHLLVPAALAALPVAAFIYVKKSLSRHHAAFILIIAMLALVFAVLHYIPELRYGA